MIRATTPVIIQNNNANIYYYAPQNPIDLLSQDCIVKLFCDNTFIVGIVILLFIFIFIYLLFIIYYLFFLSFFYYFLSFYFIIIVYFDFDLC